MSTYAPDAGRRRTVSIPHLVFGIVFLGIAAIRFVGESTDSDLDGSAIGFPIVLIGAGVVGLVATVLNARRRSQSTYATENPGDEEPDHEENDTETTTVLREDDR